MRPVHTLLLAAAMALGAIVPSFAAQPSKWAQSNPDWIEPIDPFRIADGVYYVGTRGLSSFLITSTEGHYLLDGGLPENAEQIAANIKTLGFDIRDVKFLLNSHAHFDHSGGLATLKEMSGAQMVASEGDRSALEGGFYLGSEDDRDLDAPPVKVDRIIGDEETLSLGGVVLKAHLTPGHTRGCTSWSMHVGGRSVLFFCSATVAANRLADPPQYSGIVRDYRATFVKTKDWRPDIFLANHPVFFDMEARRIRLLAGDQNAFVDADAFPKLMAALEAAFEKALAGE